MSTYCDYCGDTDHYWRNCPKLVKEAQDKENHNLAMREADDASMEELEAAGDMWDRLTDDLAAVEQAHANEPDHYPCNILGKEY